MLSFLLDEHLSPDVSVIVERSRPEIPVVALLDWQHGIWIGESDEGILRAAGAEALTLVTCDQRTFPGSSNVGSNILGHRKINGVHSLTTARGFGAPAVILPGLAERLRDHRRIVRRRGECRGDLDIAFDGAHMVMVVKPGDAFLDERHA